MKLSVVATLYRSAPYVSEFCQRTTATARQFAGDDYEIILVNDGSPDDSFDLAVEIARTDEHIVIVDLSRNYGHHKAMMTGLRYARGERIFLIDSDLEEEPEWLIPFAAQMSRDQCDVVYGVQIQRKGGLFERWSGWIFYRVFRLLTGLSLPDNIVVARLMTHRYVHALRQHREREVFMAGLWLITGFDQRSHMVEKHSSSETTYTVRKKFAQLINSITSFSNAPLQGIFVIGAFIFLFSAVYTLLLVANWLFLARPPSGYTSLIASIWLLGGMVIAFVGVVGIYLSKIYTETKQRPYTIVRSVFRKSLEGRS